jgi:drug/metabolite transporter (DMT)-like permease
MEKAKSPLSVYVPVIFAMLFWSYSFIWYKQVFIYYGPVTLIVFRLILAVPLLFFMSLVFRKLQRIRRSHLRYFLLLAFFEPFLYFIGECYGVKLITPTRLIADLTYRCCAYSACIMSVSPLSTSGLIVSCRSRGGDAVKTVSSASAWNILC